MEMIAVLEHLKKMIEDGLITEATTVAELFGMANHESRDQGRGLGTLSGPPDGLSPDVGY